jgi:hypothetical protein
MIVGIFLVVQDKFNLFDIQWKQDENSEEISNDVEEGENSESKLTNDDDHVEINIPNGLAVRVDVEVADSDVERSLGLSGRRYLGDYEGMFFIFNSEVSNPFWMKDMLIPLDIMFIDSQNFIVYIAKNQQPCSNNSCPSISSPEPFQYVLEVNSGFCEENGVEQGYSMVQYLQ